MRRWVFVLAVLALWAPLAAQAAPPTGGWRVFTVGSGLIENAVVALAPDGAGGLWLGHRAGGQLNGMTRGGLSHIRADGSVRQYLAEEPFRSCPTIDALAATPDGGLWLRLSGYSDEGSTDAQGACAQHYGIPDSPSLTAARSAIAIGYIGPDGTPQMVPQAAIPAALRPGLVADWRGRPWLGTGSGAVVRESDGSWRTVAVWDGGQETQLLSADQAGRQIAVGSTTGAIAIITLAPDGGEQVTMLPRATDPAAAPLSLTFSPERVDALIGSQMFVYRMDLGRWISVASPVAPGGTARLASVGRSLWAAGAGLARLERRSWLTIPAGETPLPADQISAIVAVSDTTLALGGPWGAALLSTDQPSPNFGPARRAFDALWERTDAGGTSWLWGRRGWAERYEPYAAGPGGTRSVRYYDKARMELNDPAADPHAPWYVTNGLLVVELVTGRAQYGNDASHSACPHGGIRSCPAAGLPLVGDLAPTANLRTLSYADFADRLGPAARRDGERIADTLVRDAPGGAVSQGSAPALASPAVAVAAYDATTGHNIPRVFNDVLGKQPVDGLFAFGHPISEPYWTRAAIGGVEQWVLVQLFERRTLTYTPANPTGWQVEMGNVGQHYYRWRYGTDAMPWNA